VRIDFAALAADLRAGDSVRSHGLLQLVRNPAVTRHADSLALVKLLLEDDSSYIRDEAKEILRRYSSPEALALLADRRPGTEDEAEAPAAAGGAGAFRFRPAAPPDDAPAETGAAPERAYLAYFHRPGCPDCHRVSAMLAELQPLFPQLKIRRYDVTRTDALLANEAMSERAGVPEKDRLVAPALFTVAQALVKDDTTRERTVDLLAGATGLPPPWTGLEQDADAAQRAIVRRYESTSLMTVLPAGLLDGLNPCAFTTIIFLLSYLAYQGHSRRQILAVGAVFTAAVFVTYYLVGLGFLLVILELSFYSWLSEGIYWLTAGFAFVIGALSIRDGIKAYQGRLGESALQLPAFLKKRIHKTIHRGASVRRGLLAAAAAGFAVSLLELACTGQVYGPTLIVLSRVPGYAWSARFYLLLYNLMFVLPLVVVFALAYFGLTSEKLTRFFRRHAALVRFLTAGLFFFFFAFMVIQMS
jgi:cytochrome c biogenesis protein CcdA